MASGKTRQGIVKAPVVNIHGFSVNIFLLILFCDKNAPFCSQFNYIFFSNSYFRFLNNTCILRHLFAIVALKC